MNAKQWHKTQNTSNLIIKNELREIKKEIVIPGEVTIYTIREKRFIQKLHHHDKPKPANSTESNKNKLYEK